MCDIGGLLPVEGLDPGSTLLVVGPPMTGKRTLATRLLARGFEDEEAAAVVSTDTSAEDIRESWFVVFDGDGDPDHQAALVAVERAESGTFEGFWTYDSDIVRRADAYLTATYVDASPDTERDTTTD